MVHGIVVRRMLKPSKVGDMQNPEYIHEKIPGQLTIVVLIKVKKTKEAKALFARHIQFVDFRWISLVAILFSKKSAICKEALPSP